MESLIEIVIALLEKVLQRAGKTEVRISNVDMTLDIPRESDGSGGFIHGSRGSFSLEIVNRKNCDVILEDFHCVAYCGKKIIHDKIRCNNATAYHRSAMKTMYEIIPTISIPAHSVMSYEVMIRCNADLSACSKLTLAYLCSGKKREVIVYERTEAKNE